MTGYRLSTKTSPIALRLPNEVVAVLTRRALKQGIPVSEYARKRLVYDTKRSHHKRR